MTELDDKYIEEAENAKFIAKRPVWKTVTAIAACAALVVGMASAPFWGNFMGDTEQTHENNVQHIRNEVIWNAEKGIFEYDYENSSIGRFNRPDIGYVAPAEGLDETKVQSAIGTMPGIHHETENETRIPVAIQFLAYMTDEYESYLQATGNIRKQFLGEKLSKNELKLTPIYGAPTSVTADVYAVKGIDPKTAVAVKYSLGDMTNTLIFFSKDADFSDFSEFKTAYSLDTMLYMGETVVTHSVATNTDTLREMYDHTSLKAMIFALDGKACTYNDFVKDCDSKKSFGIDIYHEAFTAKGDTGLQIFEEGYLMINLDGALRIFKIDETEAKAIIDYAKENVKDASFYSAERDVFKTYDIPNGGLPETSGAYIPKDSTTAAAPYLPGGAPAHNEETRTEEQTIRTDGGLTTPSYDPNNPQSSTAWTLHEAQFDYTAGYIVQTSGGTFFVPVADSTLLKKDAIVRLKSNVASIDLRSYKTGDVVKIKLLTVEESFPLQTAVYETWFVEHQEVPRKSLVAIKNLGLEILG